MSEETTNVQQSDSEASTIKAVTELKTRVDSLTAQLQKTASERDELLNKFINDQPVEEVKEQPIEVKEIKTELQLAKEFSDLCSTKPNNLDYCKKMLELDEWYRENKGESVFLPYGREVQVTANERDTADRVHDAIKLCIDEANGDPKSFDAAMSRVCPGTFPDKTRR